MSSEERHIMSIQQIVLVGGISMIMFFRKLKLDLVKKRG